MNRLFGRTSATDVPNTPPFPSWQLVTDASQLRRFQVSYDAEGELCVPGDDYVVFLTPDVRYELVRPRALAASECLDRAFFAHTCFRVRFLTQDGHVTLALADQALLSTNDTDHHVGCARQGQQPPMTPGKRNSRPSLPSMVTFASHLRGSSDRRPSLPTAPTAAVQGDGNEAEQQP